MICPRVPPPGLKIHIIATKSRKQPLFFRMSAFLLDWFSSPLRRISMTPSQVCLALNAEKNHDEVAKKFMEERANQPVEEFCVDLIDLAEKLDDEIGPWTLEPPSTMSSLRIAPEFLSALSRAWKLARPAVHKGWRYEMRALVLILNGKYRTLRGGDLEENIGMNLAKIIAKRQPAPAVPLFKGKKGKKTGDGIPMIDSEDNDLNMVG